MMVIPISDVYNQTLQVTLAQQACTINLRQMNGSIYCDLYVNSELIIAGVICENQNKIIRYSYRGFVGDLMFYDSSGSNNPIYPGLGTRYIFCYLETSDL